MTQSSSHGKQNSLIHLDNSKILNEAVASKCVMKEHIHMKRTQANAYREIKDAFTDGVMVWVDF